MVLEFVLFPSSAPLNASISSLSAERLQTHTSAQSTSKVRLRTGRATRTSRSALSAQQPALEASSCLSAFEQSAERLNSSLHSSATTSCAFEFSEGSQPRQLFNPAQGLHTSRCATPAAANSHRQSQVTEQRQHAGSRQRPTAFASASSAFGPLYSRSRAKQLSTAVATASSGARSSFPQGPGLHVGAIHISKRKDGARQRAHRQPRHFASFILASAEAAMQQHYDYATHQGRRFGRSAGRWATRIPDSVRRLIAGGVAGGVSKTVTAPIETVRLSSMAGRGTITEIAQRIWLKHGLLGFFSGNAADVIRVMPSKAIELAAFDAFKAILMKKNPKTGRQNGNGAFLTGVAGGAAGVTATIAMFPLETVRTRLAMNNGEYGSILHAMSTILREEGFGAFYRGLDASLIGVIPYAALRLGLYDGFKWSYRKVTGEQTVPASHAMVFGALAGLLSATATFPLEVVRRRMMLGTAKGNTFKAVAAIAAAEGWGSLYKGLALTWAKQVPQNAITFVAYDLSKQWLELQA